MRKERNTAAYSYLMELIIALCVFSVCGLFCITLFVKSFQLQEDAMHKNDAVTIAQSQIAILKSDVSKQLNGTVLYDETLQQNNMGNYQVTWTLTKQNGYYQGNMEVWQNTNLLTRIPFQIKEGQ